MIYAYAKIENGQIVDYPIYEGDLKNLVGYVDSPHTQFECPDGYIVIEDAPYPTIEIGPKQTIVDDTPQIIDGKWTRVWTVRDVTEEELQFRVQIISDQVRKKRNQLLYETDWTQLADSPADSSFWSSYRQQLRDIPEQEGFPWEIIWPELPTN